MTDESYTILSGLIEKEQRNLYERYLQALKFIPNGATDIPYQRFQHLREQLIRAQLELHDDAAASYKDHPDPDMRKFWGLES